MKHAQTQGSDSSTRPVVLLVGSFAPPELPCGITAAVQNLIASPCRERFDLRVQSTWRELDVHRSLLERVRFAGQLFLRTIREVRRQGVALVDLHTASERDFEKHAVVVIAAKIARCPVLLRIHGGNFDRSYADGSPLARLLIRTILRLADRVVALSETWAGAIDRIEGRARVVVVSNSVVCDEGYGAGDRLSRNPYDLLLMGNLGRAKGHFEALEALAKIRSDFPDSRLLFAGAVREPGVAAELRARANALGIEDRVQFLGPIFGEEKARAFDESGIFLLPSHTENMPVSIMEAMAAGLPVVATRVGAISEMVLDEETGLLVEPRDSSALAESIRRLFDDPGLGERMGLAGHDRVRDLWSTTKIAERTASLYRECC